MRARSLRRPGCRRWRRSPAAIVEKIAIPIVPPISWPVELRPEIIPLSSSRAPVRIGDRDGDDGDPEAEPGDEHARAGRRDVAAVLADVGEERHSGGGDQERCGERAANAVLAGDVPGGVGADPGGERRAG